MLKDTHASNLASAPRHLAKEEAQLWRELVKTYRFDDAASLTLLTQAMEARVRGRQCREQMNGGLGRKRRQAPRRLDQSAAGMASPRLVGLEACPHSGAAS